MKIRWRGPFLTHLHPAASIEIKEPFVIDMLALNELRQHLTMTTDWSNSRWTVALRFRAKVATLHVHIIIEFADAVLIAGVVAGIEWHHQFSIRSRSISRSSR